MIWNQRSFVRLALVSIIFLSAVSVSAQQEADMPDMTPEMETEMMAWMQLAQPGEHHKHLAPFVGSWKGDVTMWMGPGAEPMKEQSLAEVEWIMGGRYLQWKQTGEFGGMPYESLVIEGYNNGDKRYEAMGMDNFGTLILFFTGSCSDDGKSRKMKSRFSDPIAGGFIDYRTEYRWVDDDHFTFTSYMNKGDGEFKNSEISFERQ